MKQRHPSLLRDLHQDSDSLLQQGGATPSLSDLHSEMVGAPLEDQEAALGFHLKKRRRTALLKKILTESGYGDMMRGVSIKED